MLQEIRNVFISHIHEDDEGVSEIKELLKKHGFIVRNYSITSEKFNKAKSPDYIKYHILAPHIQLCSALVVYISSDTICSKWVNWEVEYAHRIGKRVVGVWARGQRGCELPEALNNCADAIVGWNGDNIIKAIEGTLNGRSRNSNVQKPGFKSFLEDWGPTLIVGSLFATAIYFGRKAKKEHSKNEARLHPRWTYGPKDYYGPFRHL